MVGRSLLLFYITLLLKYHVCPLVGGSHTEAQLVAKAGLKFIMLSKLALDSWQFSRLSLPGAKITGMRCHRQLKYFPLIAVLLNWEIFDNAEGYL